MELIHVNVVRAESLERPFQRKRDVPRIEIHPDAAVVEVAAHFRRQDDGVAAALERLAEDLLAATPAVDVGRVEEVHPEIDGPLDGCDRLPVVGGSVRVPVRVPTNGPCAESDLRDSEARPTEDACVHLGCEPDSRQEPLRGRPCFVLGAQAWCGSPHLPCQAQIWTKSGVKIESEG